MSKVLQVRLEASLKKKADKVFEEIGLDAPTAVRLFLTKVVATRSIPFQLKGGVDENGFTPKFQQELREAIAEKEFSGPFNSVKEMIAALNSKKKK